MKREDNQQMRDHILEAVVSCKVEAEGAEVSLNQIAHRAGISERTLTRYFPDKEMMIYTAAARYLRKKYNGFAERYSAMDTSGMNGLERLQFLLQMQIGNYRHDLVSAKVFVRAFVTIMYTAVYRQLPPAESDAATRDLVISCVQEGVADGSIRADASPLDAYLLISSCFVGLVQRLIHIYSVDMPKAQHTEKMLALLDKFSDVVTDYLRAAGFHARQEG